MDKNITDSVELSSARPDLLGLPFPMTLPPRESATVPMPGLNNPGDYLDGEKRRTANQDNGGQLDETDASEDEEKERSESGEAVDSRGRPLDDAEQREVAKLRQRDREVRQHEQAHKAAGGGYAGAVSYDYQQGPDGKRYAVGGEVSIDASKEKDPSATAAKMRQVRAAALAPAEPSGQDLQVAAEASRMENEARQEMNHERAAKARGEGSDGAAGTPGVGNATGGEAPDSADKTAPEDGVSPIVPPPSPSGTAPDIPTASYARLSAAYGRLGAPAMASAGAVLSFGRQAVDIFA